MGDANGCKENSFEFLLDDAMSKMTNVLLGFLSSSFQQLFLLMASLLMCSTVISISGNKNSRWRMTEQSNKLSFKHMQYFISKLDYNVYSLSGKCLRDFRVKKT